MPGKHADRVSLSPALRDTFFERTKSVLNIGPVYTFTTFLPQLAGDLHPDLASVPGVQPAAEVAMRMLGRQPPKLRQPVVAPAPELPPPGYPFP